MSPQLGEIKESIIKVRETINTLVFIRHNSSKMLAHNYSKVIESTNLCVFPKVYTEQSTAKWVHNSVKLNP